MGIVEDAQRTMQGEGSRAGVAILKAGLLPLAAMLVYWIYDYHNNTTRSGRIHILEGALLLFGWVAIIERRSALLDGRVTSARRKLALSVTGGLLVVIAIAVWLRG